jgi:6-phosphofructokinase 1
VEERKLGRMIALHGEKITSVPLEEVVGRLKLVDPEGQEVRSAETIGVSFGR